MMKWTGIIALTVCVSAIAVQAEVIYSLEEVDNGMDGWTTYDLTVNVTNEAEWDWLGSKIDVTVAGQIYIDGFAAATEPQKYLPPSTLFFPIVPTLEFTSYVGSSPMQGVVPSTPSVIDFTPGDVDAAAGKFKMTIYDDTVAANASFRLMRLTVTEGASGTISASTSYDSTLGVNGGTKDELVPQDIQVGEGGEPVWAGDPAQDIVDGVYPAGVSEDDWDHPGNAGRGVWNNPAREITLSLEVPPGGPITGYEWDFGGGLVKSGATVTVSVAELLAAGWENNPGPPAGTGYTGTVDILMTQQDGATQGGQLSVFLPEPGTMALLAIGCLGTLLRRRRK